jgi:hypothetical protein
MYRARFFLPTFQVFVCILGLDPRKDRISAKFELQGLFAEGVVDQSPA